MRNRGFCAHRSGIRTATGLSLIHIYMPEAFEVYAFDYLVKPFDIERVDRTLARILSLKEQEPQEHPDKIVRYEKGLDRLLVKGRESMSFVDIQDIVLVPVSYTHLDMYKRQVGESGI